MAGLFDLIMNATGRPDPTAELYARLGQSPGAPGSPAGPQPLAPPPAAGPAAGPTGPAGPPGPAPGPPPGPPQPPPQPQAYTSPPDLAQLNAKLAGGPQQQQQQQPDLMQLYAQMAQRQQANETFNRGLGGLTAAFSPLSQRASLEHEWDNMTADPGSVFSNIMKIQQFGAQQQQYQALQRAAPDLAKQLGLTPDEVTAAGPQALQTALARSEPTEAIKNWTQGRQILRQQGMSEDDINLQMPPTMLAGAGMGDLGQRQFLQGQAQAQQANKQNGTPIPPQFQGDYTHYQTTMVAQGKLQADQANDLAESQAKFSTQLTAQQDIDNRINAIKNAKNADGSSVLQSILNSPVKKAAAMGLMNADAGTGFVSGLWGQGTQAAAGLTPEERSTIENMRQLGSNVYGQAFTSTGSRRTQPEVANITAGLSQVGRLNQPYGSYMDALNNFQKLNQTGMANAYGASQRLDEVPDNLKPLVNPIYLPAQSDASGKQIRPAGPLYTGAGGSWATKASPTPSAGSASSSSSSSSGLKPLPDATRQAAQALIAKDPSQRGPLSDHLRQQGFDPSGL